MSSFDYELNAARGETTGSSQRPIRACLLAGSDLLDTMKTPGGEPAKFLSVSNTTEES